MSSAYVRILSRHKEDGWAGGAGPAFFTLRTSPTPGLCWDLEPPRSGGRRREDALDDPFLKKTKQNKQTPMIQSNVPLFMCSSGPTAVRTDSHRQENTSIYRNTHMHGGDSVMAEQP